MDVEILRVFIEQNLTIVQEYYDLEIKVFLVEIQIFEKHNCRRSSDEIFKSQRA